MGHCNAGSIGEGKFEELLLAVYLWPPYKFASGREEVDVRVWRFCGGGAAGVAGVT